MRENERESDPVIDITHPTLRNSGGKHETIEDYEEFLELVDSDRIREVTLDNWTLFKGGG